jgi:hypothetical protein
MLRAVRAAPLALSSTACVVPVATFCVFAVIFFPRWFKEWNAKELFFRPK